MRLLATALAFVAAVILTTTPAMAQPRLQSIVGSGTPRGGTTGDCNPVSLTDPVMGACRGCDIDVVTEPAKGLEVELMPVPTDWRTFGNGVVTEKDHMTTSASVSVPRATVAGFTDPSVGFDTVPLTLASNLDECRGRPSLDGGRRVGGRAPRDREDRALSPVGPCCPSPIGR